NRRTTRAAERHAAENTGADLAGGAADALEERRELGDEDLLPGLARGRARRDDGKSLEIRERRGADALGRLDEAADDRVNVVRRPLGTLRELASEGAETRVVAAGTVGQPFGALLEGAGAIVVGRGGRERVIRLARGVHVALARIELGERLRDERRLDRGRGS